MLWRERLRAGRPTLNGQVIAAFVIAVILHSLWNVFAGIESRALGARLIVEALSIAVPVASLLLLARRVSEARRS